MGARQSNTQRIRRSKYGSDDPFRLSLIFLDSDPEGPWTFHNLTDDDMAAIGGLLAEISYMNTLNGSAKTSTVAVEAWPVGFQRWGGYGITLNMLNSSYGGFRVSAPTSTWDITAAQATGNLTGILEWPCPSTLPASLPGTQITAPV